jgi:hypothetical protein
MLIHSDSSPSPADTHTHAHMHTHTHTHTHTHRARARTTVCSPRGASLSCADRMLESRPARWTIGLGLILSALRCRHPVVRAAYFLVSAHIVVIKAPTLVSRRALDVRFPTQVSKVAVLCSVLDLCNATELEDAADPPEILKQAGGKRMKWLSHTMLQGLCGGVVLFALAVATKRGALEAVMPVDGRWEGSSRDISAAVSAVLGIVIVSAILQCIDAAHRFAMLLVPMNPRLTAPMMSSPWCAVSSTDLWRNRWAGALGRQYAAAIAGPIRAAGLPRGVSTFATFAFTAVLWGTCVVVGGAPIQNGVALGVFFCTHAIAVIAEQLSGLSGAVMLWSSIALTAQIFGYACYPAIHALQVALQYVNSE